MTSENSPTEDSQDRAMWETHALKSQIELSEGKLKMKEAAVSTGSVKVAKAIETPGGRTECAWVFVKAESRDGANLTLTPDQARVVRDALDECIKEAEDGE